MSACESAELRHLRKVCEVQRDYIDGKINKEIYQRQIDDAIVLINSICRKKLKN